MFEKLKAKVAKKGNRHESSPAATMILVPFSFMAICLGGFIAYLTGKVVLFPVVFLTILCAVSSFAPNFLSLRNQKKSEALSRQYRCFYRNLLDYTSLESSVSIGFAKAVGSLEIGALKEKLTDFIDARKTGPLPLTYLNTRAENILKESLFHCLNQSEDFQSGFDSFFLSQAEAYLQELTPKTMIPDAFLGGSVCLLIYGIAVFVSYLGPLSA